MARKALFVDAGAFIARHRPSDESHRDAIQGWADIARQKHACLTSSLVIAEVARYLCHHAGNAFAAERIRNWLGSPSMTILHPDREVELEAADLLEKYADQKIGFVDCVSFVLMRRHRVESVFGFDRHFAFAGFHLWPGVGRK